MKTTSTLLGIGALAAVAGCSSDPNPVFFKADGGATSGDASAVIATHDLAMTPHDLALVCDGGDICVDHVPPVIAWKSPVAGDYIGGTVQVSVTITDDTGVDTGSVVATLGGGVGGAMSTPMRPTAPGASEYVGYFDTTKLDVHFVQPVLSIRAADLVGNQSEIGEELIVDNVAPRISLTPPLVHVIQQGMTPGCSHPFDPVGADAANDGDIVQQLFTVRARIEDVGNFAPGQAVNFPSLVSPDGVFLYVMSAATNGGTLVADSDADGVCDDVDTRVKPAGVPASDKAVEVKLKAIPVAGAPDFSPPGMGGPVVDSFCKSHQFNEFGDGSAMPPLMLCRVGVQGHDHLADSEFVSSILWMGYLYTDMEPSIWTLPPVPMPPNPTCGGLQFDSRNQQLPDGPICVAVVATDHTGNRTVSAPLRLCLDANGSGACANWDPQNAPDCGAAAAPAAGKCMPGLKVNGAKPGDPPADPFPPGEYRIKQQ